MRCTRTARLVLAGICLFSIFFFAPKGRAQGIPPGQEYVVIGWNDLGMHCMNGDFSGMCILPPYNNLWAQVVRRGNPPVLMTDTAGLQLNYRFPNNTVSSTKVNFWTYANKLFAVTLQPDEGLTHHGLTGQMTWNGNAFEVTGVPLTPFEDSAPTTEQPYQLAEVTAEMPAGSVLDKTTFVAPVSVEMHCDKCHHKTGQSTWDRILSMHDGEEGTHLLTSKPVLCANCHASNALGMAGNPSLPSLSLALHGKHAEEVSDISCYDCHPGQQTQCLRGAMFLAGKVCTDCHGSISQVANSIEQGRRPWIDEPKCSTCHPNHPENAGRLYRNSVEHGGLYCAACHDSPHSELPTAQPLDGVQAIRLQGTATPLKDCMICHTVAPTGPGPHGIRAPHNGVPAERWAILD